MTAFLHFGIQIGPFDGVRYFIIVLQCLGFLIFQLIKHVKSQVVLHAMRDFSPLDPVLIIFRPITYPCPPMTGVGKSCGKLVIRPLRHRRPSIGASCKHHRSPRYLILFVECLSSQIAGDAWQRIGLGDSVNRWIASMVRLLVTTRTKQPCSLGMRPISDIMLPKFHVDIVQNVILNMLRSTRIGRYITPPFANATSHLGPFKVSRSRVKGNIRDCVEIRLGPNWECKCDAIRCNCRRAVILCLRDCQLLLLCRYDFSPCYSTSMKGIWFARDSSQMRPISEQLGSCNYLAITPMAIIAGTACQISIQVAIIVILSV